MRREIVHALILVVVIAFSFLFPKTPLAQFDLQITAFLIVIFLGAKRFFKLGRLLESVIFTLIVMILVNTTGGLNSQFFFLLYFLLFALALLLEPIISAVATLAIIVFFALTESLGADFKSFIPVFSLAFLTPFALFMGKEYERNLELKAQSIKSQQDTFLFLSLMLKNHLKTIKSAVENFMGDHQLSDIKKSTREMEKLIEKFEKGENI